MGCPGLMDRPFPLDAFELITRAWEQRLTQRISQADPIGVNCVLTAVHPRRGVMENLINPLFSPAPEEEPIEKWVSVAFNSAPSVAYAPASQSLAFVIFF